jgi:hypothetical protein
MERIVSSVYGGLDSLTGIFRAAAEAAVSLIALRYLIYLLEHFILFGSFGFQHYRA